MKITDMISITELSRVLGKSRPTVYKYISDFESGKTAGLPLSVKKLFTQIASGDIPKRGIYEYCEQWFVGGEPQGGAKKGSVTLKELLKLIKDNEKKLDLEKIKAYIEKELL